jgi:hypothetical protein
MTYDSSSTLLVSRGPLVNLSSNGNIVINMVCIDNEGESNLSNAKRERHIIVTRKILTTYKLVR